MIGQEYRTFSVGDTGIVAVLFISNFSEDRYDMIYGNAWGNYPTNHVNGGNRRPISRTMAMRSTWMKQRKSS